jgi:hypothetical protein
MNNKIAQLNDLVRQGTDGYSLTVGIQELRDIPGLLYEIKEYKSFTEDNDPYGEHDFGTLEWDGELVNWKIDYYDQALRNWCDPLSSNCRRVVTIMLAGE